MLQLQKKLMLQFVCLEPHSEPSIIFIQQQFYSGKSNNGIPLDLFESTSKDGTFAKPDPVLGKLVSLLKPPCDCKDDCNDEKPPFSPLFFSICSNCIVSTQ